MENPTKNPNENIELSLIEERVKRVEATIDKLERIYGPLSSGTDRFEIANDPNSDLIVDCDFGGLPIGVRAPLYGRIEVTDSRSGSVINV